MGRKITGIDVGTTTAKAIRGEVKGTTFVVDAFAVSDHGASDAPAAWAGFDCGFKPGASRVGVTGRDVNIRYTRVPRLPDWQLNKLMAFEAAEIGGQSESTVASDYNVLPEIPEIEGEDVVLLALARESLLEQHLEGLSGLGGKLDAFTPNTVALYNAFLHYGVVMEDTVLVANIGHENTDVILVRGTDLVFARNLTGGAKLFDDAIAQRFGVSPAKAERIKREMASLDPAAAHPDPNSEKASRALMGPAGQILSLLQSTVAFCKSQVKLSSLKLDRVLICGGGANLDGLVAYLQGGLSVPTEIFDPFRVVDTSKLDPQSADLLEEYGSEAVVALGLATSGSDPDAYGIEILPAAVKKRRDFLGGTSFLIGAAALAVLFLGAYSFRKSGELDFVQKEESTLGAQWRKVNRTNQETGNLLEANEQLSGFADELQLLVGSGEQLVRVLAAIERNLPAGFWLEELTSNFGVDAELRIRTSDERPIVRMRGRAREGADSPAAAFEAFIAGLQRDLPGAAFKPQPAPTGLSFVLAVTLLAPPQGDEVEEEDSGPRRGRRSRG